MMYHQISGYVSRYRPLINKWQDDLNTPWDWRYLQSQISLIGESSPRHEMTWRWPPVQELQTSGNCCFHFYSQFGKITAIDLGLSSGAFYAITWHCNSAQSYDDSLSRSHTHCQPALSEVRWQFFLHPPTLHIIMNTQLLLQTLQDFNHDFNPPTHLIRHGKSACLMDLDNHVFSN